MMTKRERPPHVGEVFALADQDYTYGVGPIIARVTNVYGQDEYHGEPFWSVRAEIAQGTPEHHGTWVSRDIYIREGSFPKSRLVSNL